MEQFLNIMVGVPGSGKSTFVKEMMNPETDVWVSRDAIRFALLNDKDEYFAKETLVRNQFFALIEESLRAGKNVWADATHLNIPSRAKVLRRINTTGVTVNAVFVDIPVEYCLVRNEERSGRAYVPPKQIHRMAHQIDAPSISEGFDNIYIVDEEGSIIEIISKE